MPVCLISQGWFEEPVHLKYCKPLNFRVPFYIAVFSGDIFAALKFCILRTCKNPINSHVIVITITDAQFAPLIFAFTYLPAEIAKIKGARKFRGLQYILYICLSCVACLFHCLSFCYIWCTIPLYLVNTKYGMTVYDNNCLCFLLTATIMLMTKQYRLSKTRKNCDAPLLCARDMLLTSGWIMWKNNSVCQKGLR